MRLRRILLSLLAPVSAVVVAVILTSLALLAINKNPLTAFHLMFDYSFGSQTRRDSIISIVNRAIPLYISALAVAIGFKMNLFNIGVEGQYRLAALLAAAAGAAVHLPPPIHITLILLVGMVVGALWASIPGILKVTRGVSEVISTIMLNYIAFGVIAYLLRPGLLRKPVGASDLGMIIKTMLLSGAIAGLVGMKELLSVSHAYTLDFPADLGFTGIAVALVGRNHPAGIAIGALLFGFLERSAQILDLNNIPKEIYLMMEGIIILSVVIAYEVVRRLVQAQEVRAAAEKAKAASPDPSAVPA